MSRALQRSTIPGPWPNSLMAAPRSRPKVILGPGLVGERQSVGPNHRRGPNDDADCDQSRGHDPSELPVETRSDDGNRPTITVVATIDHELVIRGFSFSGVGFGQQRQTAAEGNS
jgi:hypothetical protein